jgi:tripartite-type tricarboxylate transporter receptor subunit TctC
MKITALAIIAASGFAASTTALAQSFPSKPVRWIVPFPPGGPADVIARVVSPRLSDRLGQPVIIENRAGGNSNIGHDLVARADPDGYTVLYVVPNVVTNPSLFKGMVDPVKQLAPLAQMTTQSYVLVAHPAFEPKTLAEIIALAKSKPGGVTCASGGGLMTFGCEWLRTMTRPDKAEFVHVQYKGNAPALTDLMSGQVNILFDLFNTSLPQIRAGKARGVALTRPSRGAPLPDLPVIAETLPGFVLVGWHGVMLPPGVPRPVIERLNRAFGEALADKDVTKRITDGYSEIAHTTPEAFGEIVQQDFVKYARIVKDAGIKPE